MSILDSAKKAYTKGKKARSSASSRGVVTSQRPQQKKKKKKERRAEEPRQQTQRSAPKPKVQNKPSAKTQPLQKVHKQSVQSQYNSYKRSAYKPTVTNTSNTSLSSAQKAFQKGQDIRANQQKKGVVGTQANKPKSNVISDFTKPKNYDAKKDLQKAYQKGSQTTYLGTKQKKTTTNLATKKEKAEQVKAQKVDYYKSDDWTNTKTELKKQNRRMWIDGLRENGWTDDEIKAWWGTDEAKKARKDTYVEAKESVKKDIHKAISDDVEKTNTLHSVNALTKGEMNRTIDATRLGKKKGNNLLKGGDRLGQKDIRRKVGSKTAETAYKGKFASGVIQGASPVDTFSASVGKYDKGASTAIKKTKESKSYLAGYGVGFGASMLAGGVASRGTSIAGMIGKGATKGGAKGLSKNVVKEAVQEYAKISGKDSAKKFAKNRVGEMIAEAPSNVLDAAKMSMDEKGNLNKNEFKKWLVVNNAMTLGMGGAMEGIGAGLTKKTANKTIELLGKREAGNITEAESKELDKYVKKLTNKKGNNAVSGDIAQNALTDVKKVANKERGAEMQAKYMQGGKGVGEHTTANAKKQGTFYTRGGRKTVNEVSQDAQIEKARKNYDVDYLEKENIQTKREIRKIDNKIKKLKGEAKRSKTLGEHEVVGAKQRELQKQKEALQKNLSENEGKLKNIDYERRQRAGTTELNHRLEVIGKRKKSAKTHEEYQRLVNEENAIKQQLNDNASLSSVAERTETLVAKKNAGTLTEAEAKELKANVRRLKNKGATSYVKKESQEIVGKIKKLDAELTRLQKKAKRSGTMEAHERIGVRMRQVEKARAELQKRLKASQDQAKNLENTIEDAGKPRPTLKEHLKNEGFPDYIYTRSAREIKEFAEELKGSITNLEKALKDAQKNQRRAFAKGNSTEGYRWAKAVNEYKTALEDAKYSLEEFTEADKIASTYKTEAKAEASNVAETSVKKAEESGGLTLTKDEQKLKKKVNKYDSDIKAAEQELKDLNYKARTEQKKLNGAREAGTSEVPELTAKVKDLDSKQAVARENIEKLKGERAEVQKQLDDSIHERGGFAAVEHDPLFDNLEKTGNKNIDDVVEKSAKDESYVPSERVDEHGNLDATSKIKKRTKPISEIRQALVDNFEPLEHIANHLPEPMRKTMLTQINELRRATKTGRAIVAEKGRKIYSNLGLTKRGRKVAEKREAFEEYCFLQHELSRKKKGNNFTDMSREDIKKRMEEIEIFCKENGYVTKDGVLECEVFQKNMRDYFRDLLKREVDAGITSPEQARNLIKDYPDYVPTYRVDEFEEVLSHRTMEEIDVGRGMKEATGGSNRDLVPLYNQMQAKTNAVMKRTELNKTLDLLCTASGCTQKDIEDALPSFKQMDDNTKAEMLLDTQVLTKKENGKFTAVMFKNGEELRINIDEDIYHAIRRWSGDERKMVTLCTIADNRVSRALTSQFKKWITDYSLIFGLKNFRRDTATALFYTTNIKGYVKNFPKAMAVCCLPDKVLKKIPGLEGLKMYKDAFNVYKENGGVISQFVARDSASPNFFDPINKVNPLKWVENFNSTLETIPRMSEFLSALDEKAIAKAGKGGDYDEAFKSLLKDRASIADAMYRAKDVTLNFDRSGYFGAALNRGAVPFFNPAIQGFDKLGRKLMRDNIKYGADGKLLLGKGGNAELSFFKDTTVGSFIKMGGMLGGMVALPTVAWNNLKIDKEHTIQDYVNGEVEGYEKQSDYNRYTNYLLPVGDGKFIKIPKARELASMQAVIDWATDNMKYGSGNKWEKLFSMESVRDWKSMVKIGWEQSGPVNPLQDGLWMPLWNTYNNKTWYGGKIESSTTDAEHRENEEYYKIWDEKTSWFAKQIGKKANISPKKVDNILDSYLGIIYDLGISQTSAKNDLQGRFQDEGFGSGIKTFLKTPFANGFLIDSVFQNSNKSDYYNYVDKRNKKLEGMKEGSDEYLEVKASISKDKNAFAYTSSQYDELVAQVYLDKNLTPTQKNYYARMLKKGDNTIWRDRREGSVTASRDPMKDACDMKHKNGKRVLSTKTIIDSCSYTFDNGGNTIKDGYKEYKKLGGKSDEKFLEVTLKAREIQRASGDSLSTPRWEVFAYSNQLYHTKNSGKVMAAYIPKDKKRNHLMENARLYEEYGGTTRSYKTMRKTLTQGSYDLGYDYSSKLPDGTLTMLLANARTKKGGKYRDLEYQANDFYIMDRMNGARCLDAKKNGHHTAKKVDKMITKYKLTSGDDYDWSEKEQKKVINAIEKEHPNASAEVKAAYFNVITGLTKYNPFGEIGDYSIDGDTGVYCEGGGYGYGRRRRRGRRHYGRGGGGGGGKSAYTPIVNTAGKNAKVTDTSKASRSSKSNLDDAYRRKVKKLREEARKS